MSWLVENRLVARVHWDAQNRAAFSHLTMAKCLVEILCGQTVVKYRVAPQTRRTRKHTHTGAQLAVHKDVTANINIEQSNRQPTTHLVSVLAACRGEG